MPAPYSKFRLFIIFKRMKITWTYRALLCNLIDCPFPCVVQAQICWIYMGQHYRKLQSIFRLTSGQKGPGQACRLLRMMYLPCMDLTIPHEELGPSPHAVSFSL